MKNASYRETKYSAEKTSFSNCTAFVGTRCIASGALTQVARKLAGRQQSEPVLVFDDRTGELIEIDLRGTVDEVVKRLTQSEPPDTRRAETEQKRGRGRPKLGVISREVTLLPGQWDWLDEQPEGASSALRRLVYEAKRSGKEKTACANHRKRFIGS